MRHLTWIALFFFPTALLCETAKGTETVSRESVAAAISSTGLPVTASQVELLSPVPTRHVKPTLEVLNVSKVSIESARVMLRCRPSKDCIPFYVVVAGLSHEDWKNPAPREQHAFATFLTGNRPHPIVHGGDHANLIIEGANFRITMPVLVLENGACGQKIRVASLDRKKTYEAEALEPHLLKASL